MKPLALLCLAALVLSMPATSLAFQEYPSLEVSPQVGYLLYDSSLTGYQSTLSYGFRADLRTTRHFGFQLFAARSLVDGGIPGLPFVDADHVDRLQLNLTRDLNLMRGFLLSTWIGGGSFNRYQGDRYLHSYSIQTGLSARRNLFEDLYLRADLGWTGAFFQDPDEGDPFFEPALTHHWDVSLSLAYLFDN